jgi:hypothetical protein
VTITLRRPAASKQQKLRSGASVTADNHQYSVTLTRYVRLTEVGLAGSLSFLSSLSLFLSLSLYASPSPFVSLSLFLSLCQHTHIHTNAFSLAYSLSRSLPPPRIPCRKNRESPMVGALKAAHLRGKSRKEVLEVLV